jgi:lipopolysaccharide export LptBFGC system permease protein LptF
MDIFELLAAIGHRSPPDTPSEIRPETQKRSDFIAVNYVIQQHLSSAVAIFLLTLIAIPMAMQTRRTESAAGTLIALALVLCYYFASIIISWFQMLPGFRVDLLIWLPDAILAVVALKFWRIFRSKIVSAKPNAG